MLENDGMETVLTDRYAIWTDADAQHMLHYATLEDIEARVRRDNINPTPVSGQQDKLENWVNRFVWSTSPRRDHLQGLFQTR